jgi:hypothetical protein
LIRAAVLLLGLVGLAAVAAHAGHELSFYPSYYPQEIRIERHDAASAAARLQQNTLHAYVGGDPFPGAPVPKPLETVESLAGYLVLTFDGSAAAGWDAALRCGQARVALAGLANSSGGYVFHPYPVTPYHADYLQHADFSEVARARVVRMPGIAGRVPDVRAGGPDVARLFAGRLPLSGSLSVGAWDATVQTVALAELLRQDDGKPWVKEGWFHAYRLLRATVADQNRRLAADDLAQRLASGDYGSAVERVNLERTLLRRLTEGCERVVVGYLTRREVYSAEFSAGVENVGFDAHTGLHSPIFLRTAKLKDFPWNGWLTLGVPEAPTAAWNPVAGFTDPAGRLIWWAVGDPAFFPAPRSTSWIGNRVTVASIARATEVPKDALLPEADTGTLRPLGESGKAAAVKITYRVLASTFHDGTRMMPADALYGLGFPYRWSAKDPAVKAGAVRLMDWLAGLRVLRTDATEREFGEVKFTVLTHTIEVYGRHALEDPLQTGSVTAPWSPVPWTVLALAERYVERRLAAFSAEEARRLGIPWLDLVRSRPVKTALAAMVDEFAQIGYVPSALAGHVTTDDAKTRWTALKAFYEKHGHFLVTNGPYRLASWSDDAVVLEVVRDFTYPLGVGSYDRYAIPLRAYVAKAEVKGDRLEVHADVDVVQKFQREYAIVRESLAAQSAPLDARDRPVCRWIAIGSDASVVASGTAPHVGKGMYAVDLRGLPSPGRYSLLVALYVRDNAVSVEVHATPVERS